MVPCGVPFGLCLLSLSPSTRTMLLWPQMVGADTLDPHWDNDSLSSTFGIGTENSGQSQLASEVGQYIKGSRWGLIQHVYREAEESGLWREETKEVSERRDEKLGCPERERRWKEHSISIPRGPHDFVPTPMGLSPGTWPVLSSFSSDQCESSLWLETQQAGVSQ